MPDACFAMPRNSCIEHPKRSRFITLWDHYHYMFDDNQAASAVLSAFEFLCNGELDRLEREDENVGEDYLEAEFVCDVNEIRRALLNGYSEKTVYSAISVIEAAGLIDVDRRELGKRNKYFFRSKRVQEAIKKRYVFDGNFTVENWECDRRFDRSFDGNFTPEASVGNLILNEDEYEKEKTIEPPTPLPEESKTEEPEDEADLQLNVDNISEWVQDLFHEKTGRQFSTIMGKDRGRFVAMAEQDGAAALKRKIEAFIDSGGKTPADFLRKMPGAFPKNPMRREPEAGRQVFERRLAVGQGGFGGRPQPSASKSQIGPRPHTDQTRGLVLRWNGIVTSRPAAFEGNCGYAVSMLEQMQMDAEFMTGFDEICQKAQKIITAKGPDDATWLTFGWLFKTPDGGAGQNWGRLLRGELDWMAKSGKSGGSAPKFETQQGKNNRVTNELIGKISRGEIKI